MPTPIFQAIVTTADRSSPVLQAITRRIDGLSASAARAESSTLRMALAPAGAIRALQGNLGGVAGAFGRVRGAIGGVISGITSLMPPLAALGGAGSLAGIFGMVKGVADAREEILRMARIIGRPAGRSRQVELYRADHRHERRGHADQHDPTE